MLHSLTKRNPMVTRWFLLHLLWPWVQEIPVGRPRPERLTRREAAKAAAAAASADPGAEGPAGEGPAAAGGGAAAAEEPEQVGGSGTTMGGALGSASGQCLCCVVVRVWCRVPAVAQLAVFCGVRAQGPSEAHWLCAVLALQADSYEFAEPKDIIPELKKEFWDGLASAKWSERKVGC